MDEQELENQRKRDLLHETFQTEGWQVLTELMEDARKALLDIRNVDSESKLHYNRGRVQQLDELLYYPRLLKDQNNDL